MSFAFGFVEIGEDLNELPGRAAHVDMRVAHGLGIGIERRRRQRRRQQHAVAVDDIGAAGLDARRGADMREAVIAGLEARDFDEPRRDHDESQAHQRAGDDEACAAGLDPLLGRAFLRLGPARARPEMARTAGIWIAWR